VKIETKKIDTPTSQAGFFLLMSYARFARQDLALLSAFIDGEFSLA